MMVATPLSQTSHVREKKPTRHLYTLCPRTCQVQRQRTRFTEHGQGSKSVTISISCMTQLSG